MFHIKRINEGFSVRGSETIYGQLFPCYAYAANIWPPFSPRPREKERTFVRNPIIGSLLLLRPAKRAKKVFLLFASRAVFVAPRE